MNTPGYRFYPTEEELMLFYLHHKLENTRPDIERVIPVLDVYNYHPRNLQSVAGEGSRTDTEQWFFFCPRQEREVQGGRPTRTTVSGYWKATGSPTYVFSSSNRIIGMKRTMVFYQGRAPNGTKTNWKMNEYKALQHHAQGVPNQVPTLRKEFSLCRVYVKTATLRSFDRRPTNPITNQNRQIEREAFPSNTNASVLLQPTKSNGSSSSDGGSSNHLVSDETLDLSFLTELNPDLNWF
ncbi:hypothetical protein LUZ63_017646 [Rhynchospora breviuscula]|uniref:NAC domain-containing protein n=1 Tax=Rhynchospora breviuscula TaxID=2022672 RepID=A0A9Q0C2W1_9POAL|nr:hypothetical protein LUZ63_017646 [Rhynchospora breviuscula]